jgi:hypothetical protein
MKATLATTTTIATFNPFWLFVIWSQWRLIAFKLPPRALQACFPTLKEASLRSSALKHLASTILLFFGNAKPYHIAFKRRRWR